METISTSAIRRHYDRLSVFYWLLWGEHIHHGFWKNGESPREAQLNLTKELATRAEIARGATVLDVGCGLGGSAFWLAREFDCSILGVTISGVQKQIAETRARLFGLGDRVRFAVKDANNLDLPEQSFDAIWTIECSEHLHDKQAFIESCSRLLQRGGKFALCAWVAATERLARSGRNPLHAVRAGMLVPSLATIDAYKTWLGESGFERVIAADVTPHVAKTWEVCRAIVERPLVRFALALTSAETRKFAKQFERMKHVYRASVLRYAMITARKI